MTDTNLPWTVFGRQVRPFSFALSLTMFQLAWSVLSRGTIGHLLDDVGLVVGFAAVVSFLLLLLGFWLRNDRSMVAGLLLATGVWASATSVLILDVGLTPSSLSAFCWTVAAGGSWLLEVGDASTDTG